MRDVSSAFWLRLQRDDANLSEFIYLDSPVGAFRWCMSPQPLVSSGETYDPFPGAASTGVEETTTLKIGTTTFVVANTGDLPRLIRSNALATAEVYIFRSFVDTPDLGRLPVFRGTFGDITHNRLQMTGQVRNQFQTTAKQFPYYTYQDTCVWRFGSVGCGKNVNSITINSLTMTGSSTPLVLLANTGTLAGSYTPGRLERGRVTVMTGANSGQIRSVRVSSGDMLALSHSLPFAISSGDYFTIYPGCRKRLIDDCTSFHNNANRFFGAPWMPKQEQAF